jgi:hypothetical protein
MSDWRQPQHFPSPQYLRRPPKGNKLKEFAALLERVQHGNRDYEACQCCEHLAKQLLPELKLIFDFKT